MYAYSCDWRDVMLDATPGFSQEIINSLFILSYFEFLCCGVGNFSLFYLFEQKTS